MISLGNNISSTKVVEPKYSAVFDGTDDYLSLDSFSSALSDDMAYSLSIWFKGDSNDTGAAALNILFSVHLANGANVLRIGVDKNGTKGVFYSCSGTSDHGDFGNVDLDDGAWHNIIITRTAGAGGQQSTLYIDGGSAITTNLDDTDPQFTNATQVSIGQEFDGTTKTDLYEGNIDEVAFWDVELDDASRLGVYAVGLEGHNLTSNKDAYDNSSDLIGYWRMGNGLFDDKANGIVHDQVNPGFGINLWDGANGDVTNWSPFGNNTVEEDDGTLKFTYVDNSAGPYIYLRDAYHLSDDLVVGATYELSITTKVNTGSVGWRLQHNSYPYYHFPSLTSTDFVTQSETFIATTAASHYLFVAAFGTGEIVWVKDITVRKLNGNPGFTSGGPTFSSDTP